MSIHELFFFHAYRKTTKSAIKFTVFISFGML